MKLLNQLWALADREAAESGIPVYRLFDRIYLHLDRPLTTWKYSCTPINSSTFASTGGDGVHFGLLDIDGEVRDESPVCMTSPMSASESQDNIIVGSNLHEFLCLGSEFGFFHLENLPSFKRYDDGFRFSQPNEWVVQESCEYFMTDPEFQYQLNLLRTEFDLKPWTDVAGRLNELQRLYLPLVQLKQDNS
ncbi:MAG: hypothetical protein LCI00_22455 [Chloroflexi bacterium]|nr:hypothetical protein [Chloroflexota bacterium]MCC6895230.1 hypothetical protein [Anaerolineae bacterium]